MSGRDRSSAPSFSQTVEIETPELVVLSYTVAGIGSRAYAALVDAIVLIVLFIVVLIGFAALAPKTGLIGAKSGVAWFFAVLVLMEFAVQWGYYVLCEALFDGQTLGKRLHRLRVVRDGGYSITFGASAIRNLMRIVDMQPGIAYAVGIVSTFFSKSGKRLGDVVAGTLVVKEEVVAAPSAGIAAPASDLPEGADGVEGVAEAALTEPEFSVLQRFLERRDQLDPERRAALAAQLKQRFAQPIAALDGTVGNPLDRLFAAERAARARGLAARRDFGAARERHAIVAAGSARWAAFSTELARAQKRGLAGLGEEGVRRFVSDYRDIAADLARLRTATRGSEASELFYLNRLTAAAHNLLYRRRSVPARTVVDFFFVEAPREIRASAVPILLAAALMFGPAAIAYTAVVEQPAVAQTFVPAAMLDRAEDGVHRAQTGDGYIDDPELFRPVMATSIIANNVQVSFAAFAFGITAGLMTVWILLSNGVSLGAVAGLYSAKGIGSLLLAFVAPHGVLELSAICIAGGAGLLLGAALIIPGERTRRRALIENGRRAIRLVGGTLPLLAVAGTLEGMVSPIPWWPLAGKLAVSGVTAVLLYVYLRLAPVVKEPRAT